MSGIMYSGSMDSYFRHCADENARERELYRLHELAEPATRWADGRMHFCFVTFDGLSAPRPRAWDHS